MITLEYTLYLNDVFQINLSIQHFEKNVNKLFHNK
jgi:hypothetical protein